MRTDLKTILICVIGVPLIFGVIRYVASLCILLPSRSLLRRFTPFMIIIPVAITTVAAITSVALVRTAATSWATPPTVTLLSIPACFIILIFVIRLILAVTPGGTDPMVYESEWQPDPDKSDAWNLHRRVQIDQQTKAWCLIAVLAGFLIMFDYWGLPTIQPLWLRLVLLYFIIGVFVLITHLGFGEVGASGLLVTTCVGVLGWPLLVVHRFKTLLRTIRFRSS